MIDGTCADTSRRTAAPPPPAVRPVQWGRGLAALRALLAEPEQTEKAFEVFQFLDGDSEERTFQRFLATPEGPRLAAERPSLPVRLSDRAALAGLPAESFGRAYLGYLDRTGFDPGGLLKLKAELIERAHAEGEVVAPLDPMREWFRDRTIVMHDLWHVLTGYGTDEMGEAALLCFTLAQVGGRANAILVSGIVLRTVLAGELRFLVSLRQAWRDGRDTGWLTGLPYEELLPLPLEEVRRRARIRLHPGAIPQGSFPAWATPAGA